MPQPEFVLFQLFRCLTDRRFHRGRPFHTKMRENPVGHLDEFPYGREKP